MGNEEESEENDVIMGVQAFPYQEEDQGEFLHITPFRFSSFGISKKNPRRASLGIVWCG